MPRHAQRCCPIFILFTEDRMQHCIECHSTVFEENSCSFLTVFVAPRREAKRDAELYVGLGFEMAVSVGAAGLE